MQKRKMQPWQKMDRQGSSVQNEKDIDKTEAED